MKSKGLVIDKFICGEKSFNLLYGDKASSARPSGIISVNMKVQEEDVRMVTVVAGNKTRGILIPR
jgi:hypothetical protein